MGSEVATASAFAGKVDLKGTLEIAEWIVTEGLSGASENSLVRGFCERLVASGIPLKRVFVGQRTLHPVYAGDTFVWQRDEGEVKQEGWDRTRVDAGEVWDTSPFHT